MLDRSVLYARLSHTVTEFGEECTPTTAESIKRIEEFLDEYEDRLAELPFEAQVKVDIEGIPVVKLKAHDGGPRVSYLTVYFFGESEDPTEQPFVVAYTETDTLVVHAIGCDTNHEIFAALRNLK